MAGIYLHIPFCKQACHYCDFHFSTQVQQMPLLLDCLVSEMRERKNYLQGQQVNTVYLGGGTPSLVPTPLLEKLLDQVHTLFPGKKSEITLEANPDDLSPANLSAWKSMGIDRLSLGIQSFQDEVLLAYNRAHTGKEAKQAIHLARAAGFEKFSIDLIYGYPYADHSLWQKDLKKALQLDPGHLSAYSLTIEPKTAFGRWVEKGKFQAPNEEFVAEQFEWLQEQCDKAGYQQYEISNFSSPNQEALHNSNYWKRVPYLGIGPSAHSFDGNARGYNPSSNTAYTKALQSQKLPFVPEILELEEQVNEEILTRLRTVWGLDTDYLAQRYQVDLLELKRDHLEKLAALGLLHRQGKTLSLTRKGMLLADSIAADLFLDSHDV